MDYDEDCPYLKKGDPLWATTIHDDDNILESSFNSDNFNLSEMNCPPNPHEFFESVAIELQLLSEATNKPAPRTKPRKQILQPHEVKLEPQDQEDFEPEPITMLCTVMPSCSPTDHGNTIRSNKKRMYEENPDHYDGHERLAVIKAITSKRHRDAAKRDICLLEEVSADIFSQLLNMKDEIFKLKEERNMAYAADSDFDLLNLQLGPPYDNRDTLKRSNFDNGVNASDVCSHLIELFFGTMIPPQTVETAQPRLRKRGKRSASRTKRHWKISLTVMVKLERKDKQNVEPESIGTASAGRSTFKMFMEGRNRKMNKNRKYEENPNDYEGEERAAIIKAKTAKLHRDGEKRRLHDLERLVSLLLYRWLEMKNIISNLKK